MHGTDATASIAVANGATRKQVAEAIKSAVEAKYTTNVEVALVEASDKIDVVVTEKVIGYLDHDTIALSVPGVSIAGVLAAGSNGTVTIAATDIKYGATNLNAAITLNSPKSAAEIAQMIKDQLPATTPVTVSRDGAKIIFQHNTAGAGNDVAAITLAGKGDEFVDEVERVAGANAVSTNTNIAVKLYKDSIAGSNLLGSIDTAATSSFDITIPTNAVEINGGNTSKFYVVLESATVPANTTVSTELQLTNVEYDDVLDNGTKSITTMNSYDQGLPVKWNK